VIGLLRAAWQEYERDHARYFAGAMVYYALISLVPLVLLVLAVLGLLLRYTEFAVRAEQHVLAAVETSVGMDVRTTVEHLFKQLEVESVVAALVSLVGLAWAASGLFRHLRLSFRAIWKYAPPFIAGPVRVAVRTTFIEYITAYLMVLTAGVLLILAVAFLSVTQWLGELLLQLPILSQTPAWLLALPGSVLLVGLALALLFRFLPPVRVPWRHVWFATVLCTTGWIVSAEIIVLLGAMFRESPTTAGAFAGLLVLMLWLNVLSQLLFLGAEVCKVLSTREASARGAA
jgi:membrane protein